MFIARIGWYIITIRQYAPLLGHYLIQRGIYTDKITSAALDKIITSSVIEIEIAELDGEILFPELFRYWFDEDGHPHKCED